MSKFTKFEKERLNALSYQDDVKSLLWLREQFEKYTYSISRVLVFWFTKKKLERMASAILILEGIKIEYISKFPKKINFYKNGQIVAKNY